MAKVWDLAGSLGATPPARANSPRLRRGHWPQLLRVVVLFASSCGSVDPRAGVQLSSPLPEKMSLRIRVSSSSGCSARSMWKSGCCSCPKIHHILHTRAAFTRASVRGQHPSGVFRGSSDKTLGMRVNYPQIRALVFCCRGRDCWQPRGIGVNDPKVQRPAREAKTQPSYTIERQPPTSYIKRMKLLFAVAVRLFFCYLFPSRLKNFIVALPCPVESSVCDT